MLRHPPKIVFACLLVFCCTVFADQAAPDYNTQIAPLLKKYCAGCHNPDEANGEFSVESFADLQRGGEHGPAILPGDAASSRIVRLITGQAEPKMPPEDEPAPSAEQVALIADWINAGATGPDGAEPDRTTLVVPKIAPAADINQPITALAWSPDERTIAIGRFATVTLLDTKTHEPQQRLPDHPGKVNAIEFVNSGSQLLTASGVAGLYGKATLWNLADGTPAAEFVAHRDTLYAATISPSGRWLATAGYDRQIVLWDVTKREVVKTFAGHNGAIYDLAFHPDGDVLASASADETIKLWHVEQGIRLDTLSQPLAEQYTVAFSPGGRLVVAGGADNRIRVWRLVSKSKPRINPLLHARFAHEGPVLQLAFTPDGGSLVSVGEDRTIKLWETRGYTETALFDSQRDDCQALAVAADGRRFVVGRMDGSLEEFAIPPASRSHTPREPALDIVAMPPELTPADWSLKTVNEVEPSNAPDDAMRIEVPATIRGAMADAADLFRFDAERGQQWMIEVNAARKKSPLDSKVEVLTADGQPIVRTLLQAVRDSYFTFRGKDSKTSDDFRVHNWQEMELNQYLYAGGEVVKLWLYPRGPDSGFKVYPGSGNRYTYFDTTALAHALHEPCYIVQPQRPGSSMIPNGLPVFPVHFINDDDSRRRWGSDSRLTFTAPHDGSFVVRLTDARGFVGPDFKYELTIRPRQPDFRVTLHGANPTVAAGSGKEFELRAERRDDYEGPIRVDIENAPPGFQITSPIIIQAGQDNAYGVITAATDAPAPTPENASATEVTATAEINGNTVTHAVNKLGEMKLGDPPKVLVRLISADGANIADGKSEPWVLEISPGETVMARVRVERHGYGGNVPFGNDDSGRNLPHGVFVDNIGLNGLLILSGQDEREFFITAAPWVPEQTRLFHLVARAEGDQASWPVLLRVVRER